MKLLYIWVENYKCLKNQGFNFSSKQKFEYNKDKKILKCEENSNYINGLFNYLDESSYSKIYGVEEVTAIVGNNGSGKSTLLDLIINISDILPYYKSNYLIVLLDEFDKISIISSIDMDQLSIFGIDEYKINSNPDIRDLNKFNYIFHSNTLEYQYYKSNNYMNVHDISTTGLMRDDNKRLYEMKITNLNHNNNVIFFNEELYRQIKFVHEFKDIDEYIDFEIPDKLNASFSDISQIKESIYKRVYSKYSIEKHVKIMKDPNESKDIRKTLIRNLLRIESKFSSCNLETHLSQFKKYLLEGIYLNILYTIIPSTVSSYTDEQYKIINNILEREIIENIDKTKKIEDFWKLIEMFLDALKEIKSTYFLISELSEYSQALNMLRDNIDKKFIDTTGYLYFNNYFSFKVDNNLEKDELFGLKNFYNIYVKTALNFNYIQFYWSMSNGENNLLSLFARFYSLIDNNTGNIKNNFNGFDMDKLIILMDEADMSFHPEWQRRYISIMIKFIKKIFKENIVHLIITTHSPIMLSDIPNDNIIYLNKAININDKNNINNRTFGANIYNLYKDKFFFEEQYKDDCDKYFGIIGEFASNKIKYVIQILDKYINNHQEVISDKNHKELDDCRKIINLIGENFTRDMLNNKYEIVKNILSTENDNKLSQSIECFDELSENDKYRFIRYIINEYK